MGFCLKMHTFRSLLKVGSLARDVSSTLAMLRNSSSLKESFRPSISPLLDQQLSSTNSVTLKQNRTSLITLIGTLNQASNSGQTSSLTTGFTSHLGRPELELSELIDHINLERK